ncbi:MAG: serine O-acetyltransferase, partial [Actinomycetes bacterium]
LWVRPLVSLYRLVDDPGPIDRDVAMWLERNYLPPGPTAASLAELLVAPECRNLYYHRLAHGGSRWLRALAGVAGLIWRPLTGLELNCDDIGPGLVVSHAHGTILTAARIGSDCWIHHQVTFGWDYDTGIPTVGDRVFVGAGAKVFGAVHIGDDARIGANAVVMSDVPAGATAVGVPARIIPAERTGAAGDGRAG